MCIWHYQEAKMGVADKFQSVISLKLFGVESWNFEISLLTPSGFFRNFFNKIWGGHPGGIVWVGMEWPMYERRADEQTQTYEQSIDLLLYPQRPFEENITEESASQADE